MQNINQNYMIFRMKLKLVCHHKLKNRLDGCIPSNEIGTRKPP